ncbi:Uma2 family endonuclease [Sulfurovum sp. bin170]|uniref:Uma2 family endonuclease n=1 Tax=Sulfurovum sp. bin170 TaxID=2695268 RepID=UPI0013DEEA16|nr:Uma2 family endonuclease [Sulfurovum sp. bin170]NEW61522.1 Uma2 family endonuclease [Sulfurovum sp. bin170]
MEALQYENFQYYKYRDYKKWEGRWELIDGIPYAMAPAPYPKHQRVVVHFWRELDRNLVCSDKSCEVYIAPVDWKIDDSTVVQPDVALFCEDIRKQFFSKTPPLIVEVLSKSTALKDVTTKMKLYEREGVQFYIIVEPNLEISDIFRLVGGKYKLMKKATKEDSYKFELSDECSTEVDFSTIF